MFDAKKISQIIRDKKKAMLNAEPGLIDTSPVPDMNAQDVEDKKQLGRIETTLDVPEKINADETSMSESEGDAATAGLTAEEKTRMPRLRAYLNTLDV